MPTCPFCKKDKSNKAYEDHLKYHKRGENLQTKNLIDEEIMNFRKTCKFVCNSCNLGFSSKDKMEKHLLTSNCLTDKIEKHFSMSDYKNEKLTIKIVHILLEDKQMSAQSRSLIQLLLSVLSNENDIQKVNSIEAKIDDNQLNGSQTNNTGSIDSIQNIGSIDASQNIGSIDASQNIGSIDASQNIGSIDASQNINNNQTNNITLYPLVTDTLCDDPSRYDEILCDTKELYDFFSNPEIHIDVDTAFMAVHKHVNCNKKYYEHQNILITNMKKSSPIVIKENGLWTKVSGYERDKYFMNRVSDCSELYQCDIPKILGRHYPSEAKKFDRLTDRISEEYSVDIPRIKKRLCQKFASQAHVNNNEVRENIKLDQKLSKRQSF